MTIDVGGLDRINRPIQGPVPAGTAATKTCPLHGAPGLRTTE